MNVCEYTNEFVYLGIHGMDCTDLVIGSARGDLGRVADYYTRDRSTPRYDSFFGGTESLMGAAAYEEGRVTTLLFRKKLTGGRVASGLNIGP